MTNVDRLCVCVNHDSHEQSINHREKSTSYEINTCERILADYLSLSPK